MNTTVAVFTRELREKSRIFLVAAALILIPYIAASFPSVSGQRGDAVATLGGATAVVYGLAVALALGVSLIGRELTEKRLSFYFAKPLSPLALWSGKVLAAVTTILGAMAIIAVPTMLFSPKVWLSPGRELAAGILLLCVALFLGSHAVATMVRSRSGWIAVDLVCAVAFGFVAFLLVRQLLIGGATDVATFLGEGGALSVLAVLAVAPLWQLARGRTDIRRNHAALSSFLWPAVGVLLAIASVYVGWIVTAPLSTINQFSAVVPTPHGEWTLISGTSSRGEYNASYLVNTRTGEHTRVRDIPWWGDRTSRDGSTLVTVELAELLPRKLLVNLRVGPFGEREKSVIIPLDARLVQSALSDDGTRLAVATPSHISVYETNSARQVMAARFSGAKVSRMYFASPSTVRIHVDEGKSVSIHELDVARRTLTKTGQFVAENTWNSASVDGSRVYVRKEHTIVDGRTGALIATLPIEPATPFAGATLNDGRVAVIARADGTLHLFDRDGMELKTIALPRLDRPSIRAQVGDSKLILGGSDKAFIVDLDRGVIHATMKGRGPLFNFADVHLMRFTEDASVVVFDEQKKLALWNVATGERRPMPM